MAAAFASFTSFATAASAVTAATATSFATATTAATAASLRSLGNRAGLMCASSGTLFAFFSLGRLGLLSRPVGTMLFALGKLVSACSEVLDILRGTGNAWGVVWKATRLVELGVLCTWVLVVEAAKCLVALALAVGSGVESDANLVFSYLSLVHHSLCLNSERLTSSS